MRVHGFDVLVEFGNQQAQLLDDVVRSLKARSDLTLEEFMLLVEPSQIVFLVSHLLLIKCQSISEVRGSQLDVVAQELSLS